ncbi:hypothetical protein OG500_37295 [Kitasatospora sp. NBC_01250]|uniref:hypothetical protein n=1 Tax=unclassified Kitasatospora TaxID=2633591 RepID=UPI002E1441C8|nr:MULTISPECIES: hypothetical protein [unclassified Kitasatospora]WSJ71609.1 hypothetical protein OG294_38995 [Kitasatospora sp. NBC_01302]
MSADPHQGPASDEQPLDLVDEGSPDGAGAVVDLTSGTDAPSPACQPTRPGPGAVPGPMGALPVSLTEIATGLGAAATAVSVVAKAKIEARAEVRKAEIEAQVRRLEITEETRREQMRLDAERPA